MKPGIARALIAAGSVLVLAGVLLVGQNLHRGPAPAGELRSTLSEGEGSVLPPFRLNGPRGEFANADLLGRWTFLFFGYTRCPDVCPTALSLMKEVKAELGAVSPAPTFQVVFVSVDPQRDTPALLQEYMAAFDPAFIGVSGDDAALRPLVDVLKVSFRRNDRQDKHNYTVDHSAAIHLIDPQGRPQRLFPPPQQASALVAELLGIARR